MDDNKSKLNISLLLDSKGNNKILWENFLKEIMSGNKNLNFNIISKLNQCLIEKENLELAVDIIDFIVDYGKENLVKEIASELFLNNFIHILSVNYKSDKKIQELVLYLVKKWANKYKGNEALKNFNSNYDYLAQKRLYENFDDNKEYETYLKYITTNEISEITNKNFIINLYSGKTIFENPFAEETVVKDNKENLNGEKRKNLFENEDAPPSFGEMINSNFNLISDNHKNSEILRSKTNMLNIHAQNNNYNNSSLKENIMKKEGKNKENQNLYIPPKENENNGNINKQENLNKNNYYKTPSGNLYKNNKSQIPNMNNNNLINRNNMLQNNNNKNQIDYKRGNIFQINNYNNINNNQQFNNSNNPNNQINYENNNQTNY